MSQNVRKRNGGCGTEAKKSSFILFGTIMVKLSEFIKVKDNVYQTIKHMVRAITVLYTKSREDAK